MKLIIFFIANIISLYIIYLFGKHYYRKDTIKEPKKLLRDLFIYGIISALLVIFISSLGVILFPIFNDTSNLNSIIILIFYCYIFIATTEELSKFYMIYKNGYQSKEFDQAYDIILYSIFVSLGFAVFENIIYLIETPSIYLVFYRSLTAVIAHICFQIIMGYFLYKSKLKDKKKNINLSIFLPILLHGTYDFCLFSGSIILIILDFILLIAIIIIANKLVKKLILIDKNNINYYCPNCHTLIKLTFCPKCGYKKHSDS